MKYFLDEKEISIEELDKIVNKSIDYIVIDRISRDKTAIYFATHSCDDT